ncbi:protein translocase subunit SecF [Patescibacteria group bacterium]|nr:protein translocase subunit SecF [Patescibacteria group bacterium]
MFDLIKYKKLSIGISIVLVLVSLFSISTYGFKQGVDFAGGTLWQLSLSEKEIDVPEIKNYLETTLGLDNFVVTTGLEEGVLMIRAKEFSEEQHQIYFEQIKQDFGQVEELRFESIGPIIGAELREKAIWAFILTLFGISLYIAFAFRKVSYPVSSWRYGWATLICLFHDAIISAGLYAWWGNIKGLELDSNFVVAILAIMGFSVHDTIVVFDRIRENLITQKGKKLGEIINISINQTLTRSINTSFTLVLVLTSMFLFGAFSLSHFVLLILVGTVIGTYSSIFLASPLLTYLQKK